MAARRRTRPGTFLSLPHHPEESVILQLHLSQVWCLPHSVVFFLKLTSFYFLILAVLNSAPVSFPESYFSPFILKGGMLHTGPVWSHRWCELWGWSLEPLFSDFSHSLSHPSGSETLWDLPFLLTIKKKKVLSPAFNFDEVINLTKDSFL